MKSWILLSNLISAIIVNNAFAHTFIEVEWQHDFRNHSEDQAVDSTHNSFIKAESDSNFALSDNFSIDSVLVFEQFEQASHKNMRRNILFDSQGLFVQELKCNYENGPFSVWAGKFNPGFGTAWDSGQGIWTEDLAADYEITEQIGGGIAFLINQNETTQHTIAANTFFADTTFLSDSIITKRQKTRLSDGGVGNTEKLSSFTLTLDSENIFGINNVNSHLGVRRLAKQTEPADNISHEFGYVAGVSSYFPINENVNTEVMAEYVGIKNFGGTKNQDNSYKTLTAKTILNEKWNFTLGGSRREINSPSEGTDMKDFVFQATAGYELGHGFSVDAGMRLGEEENNNSNSVGFLFTYTKEL